MKKRSALILTLVITLLLLLEACTHNTPPKAQDGSAVQSAQEYLTSLQPTDESMFNVEVLDDGVKITELLIPVQLPQQR